VTANVQISGKANNGIIFVVGGNDADEFRVNLAATVGSMELADSIIAEAAKLVTPPTVGGPSPDEFQQAAQNIQNGFPGSQPANQGYQQSRQAPPPQQRQASGPPPGVQPPLCNHGWARKYVAGVSKKNNKPYKMWACEADRNEQCEPIFIR
jgi:hypothetical protein